MEVKLQRVYEETTPRQPRRRAGIFGSAQSITVRGRSEMMARHVEAQAPLALVW